MRIPSRVARHLVAALLIVAAVSTGSASDGAALDARAGAAATPFGEPASAAASTVPLDPNALNGTFIRLVPAAQPADDADNRTWFGWLSGFVGVILVLGVAAALVLVIRSTRRNPAPRRSHDQPSR